MDWLLHEAGVLAWILLVLLDLAMTAAFYAVFIYGLPWLWRKLFTRKL